MKNTCYQASTEAAYNHINGVIKFFIVLIDSVGVLCRKLNIKTPAVDGISLQLCGEHDASF